MPIATEPVGSLPRPRKLEKAVADYDADGVPRVCSIAVATPRNPHIEAPRDVCDDLMLACRRTARERLGAPDDRGFSPLSIDVKPGHGSPDAPRDIAYEKIAARVQGAAPAAEQLNV